MRPYLARARRAQPLLVLTPGWCGERALARLVAAGGSVRCSGFWLSVARPGGEPGILRYLSAPSGDQLHLVLATPGHLWAINHLDPHGVIGRLHAQGVAIAALERRSPGDSGLSRAVCGPAGELLPQWPKAVEPADVLVQVADVHSTAAWFDEVLPDRAMRLVFEDDLVDETARAAAVARICDRFSLATWEAPPDPELPTAGALWAHVANPQVAAEVLEGLARDDGAR